MFKAVRVHEDGVIGIIIKESSNGAFVVWLVDGFCNEYFLESDEYTPIIDYSEDTDD